MGSCSSISNDDVRAKSPILDFMKMKHHEITLLSKSELINSLDGLDKETLVAMIENHLRSNDNDIKYSHQHQYDHLFLPAHECAVLELSNSNLTSPSTASRSSLFESASFEPETNDDILKEKSQRMMEPMPSRPNNDSTFEDAKTEFGNTLLSTDECSHDLLGLQPAIELDYYASPISISSKPCHILASRSYSFTSTPSSSTSKLQVRLSDHPLSEQPSLHPAPLDENTRFENRSRFEEFVRINALSDVDLVKEFATCRGLSLMSITGRGRHAMCMAIVRYRFFDHVNTISSSYQPSSTHLEEGPRLLPKKVPINVNASSKQAPKAAVPKFSKSRSLPLQPPEILSQRSLAPIVRASIPSRMPTIRSSTEPAVS